MAGKPNRSLRYLELARLYGEFRLPFLGWPEGKGIPGALRARKVLQKRGKRK